MTRIDLGPAAAEHVLALADDEHLIGAHHSTWIGVCPFLEEDLAFCSIAQDELGHAIGLYELLTDDVDRFALLRAPEEYRSCAYVERLMPGWADAFVRHWLYERAEQLRWDALTTSTVPELAALALAADREEAFHRRHAEQLMERLTTPGTQAAAIIASAVNDHVASAASLFTPVTDEATLVADGVVARSAEALLDDWWAGLGTWAVAHGVDLPPRPTAPGPAARRSRTDDFTTVHGDLTAVISLDPTAVW